MTKISIIVPVKNEEKNIVKLVTRIHESVTAKHISYELILIDDHSTDKTTNVAKELQKLYPIRLFTKQGASGKGFSIVEGVHHAQSDLICMIDADLQYDPHHIPEMLEKIDNNPKVGVVIAERKTYKGTLLRKIASRINAFVVGRMLFGLKHDIQSGLKIFRKEIFQHIDLSYVGPWSFDIPLLYTAKELGFSIKTVSITFEDRNGGQSKIGMLEVSKEIVANAIKLRTSNSKVFAIQPKTSKNMIGAGVIHKGKRYITHSQLSHHDSAIHTLKNNQKIFMLGLLAIVVAAGVAFPLGTIISVMALLNVMYFLDMMFNLIMILRSLKTPRELSISEDRIKAIDESKLPIYTILCPLYREAHMIPQFVKAIGTLDWPKEKLDVMLLLEEDDKPTIEAAQQIDLPDFVRIVVVPDSKPKTKPKATNYGLAHARGEYVVIFDAEDMPDPLQLKKVYLAFAESPKDVVCMQAKLNYYNPHQNLLTRIFTAEYSLWFDLILTGLQTMQAPIPLGGTSNHFKLHELTNLKGWDSFNVTEDCDLGIRLAKYGYKTAIVDSVTLEEANSDLLNWINQRSRWIKGYIQSYLVHMRRPLTFFKEDPRNFLSFQLTVGGKILSLFVNPLMWLITILYFSFRATFGITIEKFFPAPVLYMAVLSLVFGNFLYLYYYMIGCAKKGQWGLIKYIFVVPFYWLAMSFAAWKALIELMYKPHFWAKTVHGLHMESDKISPDKKTKVESQFIKINKKTNKYLLHLRGILFVVSMGLGSVINFLYSAYLGRILEFEDFALIGLIGGLLATISIISSAFSTTINYKTGFLTGKHGDSQSSEFWREMRKNGYRINFILTCIWLLAAPFLLSFFNTSDIVPWLLFAPVILLSLTSAADRGFLAGKLRFDSLAVMNIIEPIIKLGLAVLFVFVGLQSFAYSAVPFSVIGIFFVGWYFATRETKHQKTKLNIKVTFPWKFYLMTLFSGFSLIFFTSADVLLAKHYLSPIDAGKYTLLVLAGKMIIFMGAFISPFITPLVSRNEGKNISSTNILKTTVGATSIIALGGFIIFGIFGQNTVPLLFGDKANSITNYLLLVTASLGLFTISKVITEYYLTKKNFIFSIAAFTLSAVQIFLFILFHDSLTTIVYVMALVWSLHLGMNVILHLNIEIVRSAERKFLSNIYAIFKVKNLPQDKKHLSILIYNWRDITHKWAGGAEVYIHEISKRWVAEGHNVTVFCGNSKNIPNHKTIDGVEIYSHGNFVTVYFWAFIYYFLRFKGKFDVIIDCENGIPFFTPWYSNENKFLLIHHVHQEIFRKSLNWPLAQFALFLEAKIMPLSYRNVQVITVSPSSKAEIEKHQLTHTAPKVVYNGVDLKLFKPGIKSNTPMVMYLGRLQYYKSLNIFIKSAKIILKKIPNAKFVIAGEGEERKKLESYMRKLNLQDNIEFLGKVTNEDRIKLFKKAWVFVNPSFMEGWGITTIEANACGTPTIASDVPGLRDSVKNEITGYLIPYGNSDEFAEKITLLLENEDTRIQMSNNARLWAEEFSWDSSAEKFMRLIMQKNSVINYSLERKLSYKQ